MDTSLLEQIKFVHDECSEELTYDEIIDETNLNIEVSNLIFDILKRNYNIKVNNIEYLCGYFLFLMFPASVIHFNVDGLSNKWKFGMWISKLDKIKNDDPYIQVFCQHSYFIDKFKPYASDICVSITKEDFIKAINGNLNERFNELNDFAWDIHKAVQFVKLHPILAIEGYCQQEGSSGFSNFLYHRPSKYIVKTYLQKNYNKMRKFLKKNILLPYTKYILSQFSKYDIVDCVKLKDLSKEDVFVGGVEYEGIVKLKENVSDEYLDKMVNEVFCSEYPKDFSEFGKISSYENLFSIQIITHEGKLIHFEQ